MKSGAVFVPASGPDGRPRDVTDRAREWPADPAGRVPAAVRAILTARDCESHSGRRVYIEINLPGPLLRDESARNKQTYLMLMVNSLFTQ